MKYFAFLAVWFCLGSAFAQSAKAQSIPKELARQLLKDDPMVKELSDDEGLSFDQIVKRLSSTKVDLNGDKVVEYIVSGIGCGNANCPTWIYRKSGSRYIQIPVENDLVAASVEAKQTKTNGFRDLVGKTHTSAYEGSIFIFKYSGTKYVLKECFEVAGGYIDENGNLHPYKSPKITKTRCN